MNQIIKELREVKKYTNDSVQAVVKYVNDLANAVTADNTEILKKFNKIEDRLTKIEVLLGIPKTERIKSVVEDVKDEYLSDKPKAKKSKRAEA